MKFESLTNFDVGINNQKWAIKKGMNDVPMRVVDLILASTKREMIKLYPSSPPPPLVFAGLHDLAPQIYKTIFEHLPKDSYVVAPWRADVKLYCQKNKIPLLDVNPPTWDNLKEGNSELTRMKKIIWSAPAHIYIDAYHDFKPVNSYRNQLKSKAQYTIQTFHGVADKGYHYVKNLAKDWNFLFCHGEYQYKRLLQAGCEEAQLVRTGSPLLDPVFDGRLKRPELLAKYGLSEQFTILYAPTYTGAGYVSSMDTIGKDLPKIIPDNWNLICKSHNLHHCNLFKKWERKNIKQIYDVCEAMFLGDICISDYSGFLFQFASQDKPIILIESGTKNKPDERIELVWRDIGIRVKTLPELKLAMETYCQNPKLHSDRRQFYTNQLFCNKGKAGKVAADFILKLYEEITAKTTSED